MKWKKKKEDNIYEKLYKISSKMTGKPIGSILKLKGADLSFIENQTKIYIKSRFLKKLKIRLIWRLL